MSSREQFPGDRGCSSAAVGVAERISAFALSSILPLATDMEAFAGLADLPVSGVSGDASLSRLDGVRSLMDACGDRIAVMRVHQNQCAADAALTLERLVALSGVESSLLTLDSWQQGWSLEQVRAEVAMVLHVSEGAAGRLIEQSVSLVRLLPATLSRLSEGVLGWEFAVVVVEETSLLREAGVPQTDIDVFEDQLLSRAESRTLPAFRSTARRLRERCHPESIVARSKRAYGDRSVRVSRGMDGMSWLSLYAPSPTIEAIWDQCTYTAQAAQGAHEERTLTQLRADIAAALLLQQSLAENHIHAPAPEYAPVPVLIPDPVFDLPGADSPDSAILSDDLRNAAPGSPARSDLEASSSAGGKPWYMRCEPDPCNGGTFPDPWQGDVAPVAGVVPVFDDPDYRSSGFVEPDPRNDPYWHPAAQLPALTPVPTAVSGAVHGDGEQGGGMPDGVWPPLPQVTPVIVVPVLSLLGVTSEPAWMEGAGPISIEVARRLTATASSFLRVLVDPITNKPLDSAPERYRVDAAMRTMLRIRDEFCQFPGCMAKAISCDVDHVQRFETGGRSVFNNLECLCARHHLLKHFKDDKNRWGVPRCVQEPERNDLRLRGWVPVMEAEGHVGWTAPSGRYYPPESLESCSAAYPGWLKDVMVQALSQDLLEDYEGLDSTILTQEIPSAEDEAILDQLAVQRALRYLDPLEDNDQPNAA